MLIFLYLLLFGTSWVRGSISSAVDQTAAAPNRVNGTATGRVWCTDTQTPARFATVMLQPISEAGDPGDSRPSFTTITGIDGNFVAHNIPSGRYLVLTGLPGYVSPLTQVAREDLVAGDRNKLSKELGILFPQIIVMPNQTSSVNIFLNRGAEMDGTVQYDDGAPVIDGIIRLFRRNSHSDGQKEVIVDESLLSSRANHTDSHGRFRIQGLPAGDYTISASLPTRVLSSTGIMSNSMAITDNPLAVGGLQVYFKNVLRPNTAKDISVVDGEVRTGIDIEIPLSKLHSVTGSVVSESDAHGVRQGIVELLYAEDMSLAQRAYLGQAERLGVEPGAFRFNYVINGSYILRVIDAADDTLVVSNTGTNRATRYKEIDVPLTVDRETTDIVVRVQEMDAPHR